MISEYFDLRMISGWKNIFLAASLFCYTVTQADLDALRPLYWLSLVLFFFCSLIEWLHSKNRKGGILAPYLFWVICVAGICVASQMWALDPDAVRSSQYMANCAYVCLILIGLAMSIRSRVDIFQIMDIYIISAIAVSVFLVFAQLLSGEWARLGDAFGIVPNGPAMQMGFALMFCFVRMGTTEGYERRYAVFAIWLVISIVATDSRKIVLASILAVVLFACYRNRRFFDVRILILAAPIVIACLLAVIFIPFLSETIGYRFVGVFTGLLGDGSVDMSGVERDYYRSTALMLFSRNPILGVGFEGFAAYLESIGYWHVAYSHCNYTELLSNIGIVGLSVYYSMYLAILLGCLKEKKLSSFVRMSVIFILIVRLIVEYAQVVFIDVDNYVVLLVLYGLAFVPQNNVLPELSQKRGVGQGEVMRRAV